jgi:hypothetical protein
MHDRIARQSSYAARVRSFRWLAVIALGSLAGCGGCDSCFGGSRATEDASAPEPIVTAPATVAPAARDAGRAAHDDEDDAGKNDAGRDAGGEADSGFRPDVPLAVPRPSGAPMAMGAMQSCGVYDGPLCEKQCPKGNCRQECDGVSCVLACRGGWCSQLCGPSGTCKLSCPGGHCTQVCAKAEDCTKDCAGGGCQ